MPLVAAVSRHKPKPKPTPGHGLPWYAQNPGGIFTVPNGGMGGGYTPGPGMGYSPPNNKPIYD